MSTGINAINEAVKEASAFTHPLFNELGKVIVGQKRVIEEILVAIFAGGHCVMQGVPGLAKTLLVSTLAQAMELSFHRIQFTPD
ncbi:MAG TPA: MoxR family ATPase, partial [Candidatus Binatia bacterium]|nr:MoxR family ATPase [Candidatus Binatia bacterium]